MSERDVTFICDFDDLITNPRKSLDAYQEKYKPLLSTVFKIPQVFIDEKFRFFESDIRDHPENYVYKPHGVHVMSGGGDHTIFTYHCAMRTLNAWKTEEKKPIGVERNKWTEALYTIFRESYIRAEVQLQDYAPKFIHAMHTLLGTRFIIMSGSEKTDILQGLSGKLRSPHINIHSLNLIGSVKKSFVDHRWIESKIPQYVRSPGYPRSVPLRRPYLYDHLKRASENFSVDIISASDMATMDLSLAEYLHMYTILVPHEFTSPWEQAYYANHPNGKKAETLFELQGIIEQRLS